MSTQRQSADARVLDRDVPPQLTLVTLDAAARPLLTMLLGGRASASRNASINATEWQNATCAAGGGGGSPFRAQEASTDSGSSRGSGARTRPILVLVADDDIDHRDLCARRLSMLGCQVLAAGDGDDAIRLATLTKPDLVLMDLVMPGTDGIEATRRLRTDERTKSLRIVAMTNFGRKWQDAAKSAGCDLVLFKQSLIEQFDRVARMLLPITAR